MDCNRVRDLISEYVDGMLTGHTVEAIEAHVSGCAECAKEVAVLKAIVHEAGQVTALEPPTELRQRIAAATTSRPHATGAAVEWLVALVSARKAQWAAGAAAAGVLAVGLTFKLPQMPQDPAPVAVTQPGPAGLAAENTEAAKPTSSNPKPVARVALLPSAPVLPAVSREVLHSAETKPKSASTEEHTAAPVSLPSVPEVVQMEELEEVSLPTQEVAPEQIEKTTKAAEPVSGTSVQKRETPVRDPLVKVAVVCPTVGSDSREWIRQVKTQGATHSDSTTVPGNSITDSKF